jgi:hypothetical protein
VKKQWISFGLVSLVVVLAAACGSSSNTDTAAGSGGTEAATSLTAGGGSKADFIAQADAICTDTAKKTAALAIDLNAANTVDVAKQADAIDQGVVISQQALDQLKALTPPAGDDAVVAAFWSGIDQQITSEKQVAADVRANDLQGAQSVTAQVKAAGQQSNAQMASYGFVACAK